MDNIVAALNLFLPIGLDEMAAVKLMDRTDTKFTFRLELLPMLLKEVEPYYKCLQIKNSCISNYKTLYYDTTDLKLYHQHHNGRLNRYKIRQRTYVDSQLSYLEIKFKNNKGRTIKDRINEKEPNQRFNDRALAFLSRELPFNPDTLVPTVWVNYKRITLVNKVSAERVTLDLNLEFKKDEKQVSLNNLVIAEVKQEKRKTSPFLSAVKKRHIREGSISKYCLAITFMYNHVKKNNFKEKLVSLKHILTYDTPTNIN